MANVDEQQLYMMDDLDKRHRNGVMPLKVEDSSFRAKVQKAAHNAPRVEMTVRDSLINACRL